MNRYILIIASLLISFVVAPLAAQELASTKEGIVEAPVRLIAGHVPGKGDMLGLHFTMDPKWKVYWRSPGDAGFPPQADWKGSTGVSNLAIDWPVPEKFTFYGLETYGYGDEVILPVRFDRDTSAARIRLELFYAACADICVPVTANLSLELPGTSLPVSTKIAAASAQVPEIDPDDVLVATSYADELVQTRFDGANLPANPALIVEGRDDLIFGATDCHQANGGVACDIPILERNPDKPMVGTPLIFTLHGLDRAVEMQSIVRGRK